ncbi:hypothetical protein CEXT_335881 [Caerostris extrusa]|uniref:Uncharacterized protein n=1 Tax=Caerostris extrusa TaxID=172846 RepID=A0AAV4M2X3_CAEEX|nr:hypothetical protein CEXT_335881 [Caerostris extrusa]
MANEVFLVQATTSTEKHLTCQAVRRSGSYIYHAFILQPLPRFHPLSQVAAYIIRREICGSPFPSSARSATEGVQTPGY